MPPDPNGEFHARHAEAVEAAAELARRADELLAAGNGIGWFAKVYHYVTAFELRMIDEGHYTYPIMKLQEVVAFYETYRVNLDAWLAGRHGEVEPNWRVAFQAAESVSRRWHLLPSMEVMNALLPSIHAHIRFDLPRAIASVFETYYQNSGVDLSVFKPDFDRMQSVFEDASAAILPEIRAASHVADPGAYGVVQRMGFPFIFDVAEARQHAWERATDLVSLHTDGIRDPAETQRRLEDYARARHRFTGRHDFDVGGERIRDYDWNNQRWPHPDEAGPTGFDHEAARQVSANFPPHLTRTGADLPQQVHELVDRARQRLAEHPELAVVGRLDHLDAVARAADELQAAADRSRVTGDLSEVVARVRALSDAVTTYGDRFDWRDLHGLDPLDSVELAHRAASVDPVTHTFHAIDQAIMIAKIGRVLGPEFEAYVTGLLDRTVPMRMDSIRALAPEIADDPRIRRQVEVERPLGFRDAHSGRIFISPDSSDGPRSIGAVASTLVHEGVHGLQLDARVITELLDRVPPAERSEVARRITFEREFQSFVMERAFLRALAGRHPTDFTSDLALPRSDGLREVAAATPQELADIVRRRYQLGPPAEYADILDRYPQLGPERIVGSIEIALREAIHALPSERRPNSLVGPITAELAARYGVDLGDVGLRPGAGDGYYEFARPPTPEPSPADPDPPVYAAADAGARPASGTLPAPDPALARAAATSAPAESLDRLATEVVRVEPEPVFRFREFYGDAPWLDAALRFEQGVGALLFHDPDVVQTARSAVQTLRDTMQRLAALVYPGESPDAIRARVEAAFFRANDPGSAGQVGPEVGLETLLTATDVNVRELMTAFYNAAFNNRGAGTLVELLLRLQEAGRLDEAAAAGVDVALLRSLGNSGATPDLTSPVTAAAAMTDAERAARNITEFDASRDRHRRPPDEQARLASTRQRYEDLGVPLSDREIAYQERHLGHRVTPETPLLIREGAVLDELRGPWADGMRRLGFPVADGLSGTTARMLVSFRLLGVPAHDAGPFLGGLMAWMLPGPDHSLFEILRGADLVGVGRLDPQLDAAEFGPMDLYRWLRLDLDQLRALVPDGLLPHEARYLDHARNGDFTEVTDGVLRHAAQKAAWLRSADLTEWLERNGIDPSDEVIRAMQERLTEAHIVALTVYTRYGYSLLNETIRAEMDSLTDVGARRRVGSRLVDIAAKYLERVRAHLAEPDGSHRRLPGLPMVVQSVLHGDQGPQPGNPNLSPVAQAWVDAMQRLADADVAGDAAALAAAQADVDAAWQVITRDLRAAVPALMAEMRWHADMIHDALMALPAIGSDTPVIAFRGDSLAGTEKRVLYGSRVSPVGVAHQVVSMTRDPDTALRFVRRDLDAGRPGVVVYVLTGVHARDIAPFSWFPSQAEAVLPPGARTTRVPLDQLAAELPADVAAQVAAEVARIQEALPRYVGDGRKVEIVVMREVADDVARE